MTGPRTRDQGGGGLDALQHHGHSGDQTLRAVRRAVRVLRRGPDGYHYDHAADGDYLQAACWPTAGPSGIPVVAGSAPPAPPPGAYVPLTANFAGGPQSPFAGIPLPFGGSGNPFAGVRLPFAGAVNPLASIQFPLGKSWAGPPISPFGGGLLPRTGGQPLYRAPGRGSPGWAWAWASQVHQPVSAPPRPPVTGVGGGTVARGGSTPSAGTGVGPALGSDHVLVGGPEGQVLPQRTPGLVDGRFEPQGTGLPAWSSRYPRGWPGHWTSTTEERRQYHTWLPAANALVAANRGARGGALGTKVVDVTPAGDVDLEHLAQLQSAWQIARWQNTGVLAWQLGDSGEEDRVPGWGMTCARGVAGPTLPAPVGAGGGLGRATPRAAPLPGAGIYPPPRAVPPPELVLAAQSWLHGGPLVVPPIGDQHDRTPPGGPTPTGAGHLHRSSIYWGGPWDCPLELQDTYEPLDIHDVQGTPHRVHCQIDALSSHVAPDGIPGKMLGRWHVVLPQVVVPPPRTPPPPLERIHPGKLAAAAAQARAGIAHAEGGRWGTWLDALAPRWGFIPQPERGLYGRDIRRGRTLYTQLRPWDIEELRKRPIPAWIEGWAREDGHGHFVGAAAAGGILVRGGDDEDGEEDETKASITLPVDGPGICLASIDREAGRIVSGGSIRAVSGMTDPYLLLGLLDSSGSWEEHIQMAPGATEHSQETSFLDRVVHFGQLNPQDEVIIGGPYGLDLAVLGSEPAAPASGLCRLYAYDNAGTTILRMQDSAGNKVTVASF